MKLLITGASGMLGLELCRAAVQRFGRDNMLGLTHYDLDVTSDEALAFAFERYKPTAIINAAGLVKGRSATDRAFEWVNSQAPWKIAQKCDLYGIRLVQVSSDCVFAGERPHDEHDAPNARDVYGVSKAKGEIPWGNHLNVRLSFVGIGRRGLLNWLLQQKSDVRGYTAALWNGMTSQYAARRILDALDFKKGRVLHLCGRDCTKYDVLVAANKSFNLGLTIERDATVQTDMRLRSIYPQPEMPPIEQQIEELARSRS